MVRSSSNAVVPQTRIDSWKGIAKYLGKSSRSVQRWHREYGLPVHRLGVDTGSVFAYADELDRWLQNRDRDPHNTLIEMPRPTRPLGSQLQPEPAQSHRILELLEIIGSGKAHSAALVNFAQQLWQSLSNDNLKLIARCYRKAIDLCPGNAEAFAGLAHAFINGGLMGDLRIPEAYVSARKTLDKAFDLNEESPEAVCAAALLKMTLQRDWLGARRDFDELLNRPLPSRRAVVGRALLHIAEGSPDTASNLLQEVLQHSVLSSRAAALYYWSKYLAGEYREALDLIEEARCSGNTEPVLDAVEALASINCEKLDASVARIETLVADSARPMLVRGVLGYALALSGQIERATETLDAIMRSVNSNRGIVPYAVALVLIGLKETHGAVQWLEQSYRRGSLWSLGFQVDPLLQSMRDEPSYRMFLSGVSYPAPGRHCPMKVDAAAI